MSEEKMRIREYSSAMLIEKAMRVNYLRVFQLCEKMKDHFSVLPNVYHIEEIPEKGVCVVGDLHGNSEDLLNILNTHGVSEGSSYLFLGDYVDRGFFSLRILMILFYLILEGNHETERMTGYFGFQEECVRTYGIENGGKVYRSILTNVFQYLPLAAVIGKRIFCVHAGLSQSMVLVSDIDKVERKKVDLFGREVAEYFDEQPMILVDLLWSDPKDGDLVGFHKNLMRGCGYFFGKDVTKRFLAENGLDMMIRSHEFVPEGVKYCHDRKIVSIFSSSNYCFRSNKGTIAMIYKDFSVKVVVIAQEDDDDEK